MSQFRKNTTKKISSFLLPLFFGFFVTHALQATASASSPAMPEPDIRLQTRALVLDGGGFRGILSLAAMQTLRDFKPPEEGLKSLSDIMAAQSEGRRALAYQFRGGITGTSTGAIIALALTSPYHTPLRTGEVECADRPGWGEGPYTLEEISEFYEEMAAHVFVGCSRDRCRENCAGVCLGCSDGCLQCSEGGSGAGCWTMVKTFFTSVFCCCGGCGVCRNCDGLCGSRYSAQPLRRLLEEKFSGFKLSEAIIPTQIVTFDILSEQPIYFRSTTREDRTDRGEYDARKLCMVDVALASSAAPTFFPAHEIEHLDRVSRLFIDGGVFDNSAIPAALGFTRQLWKESHPGEEEIAWELVSLLSLGTGRSPLGIRPAQVRDAGKITWAMQITNLSISATAESHRRAGRELLSPGNFYVLQADLPAEMGGLDDISPYTTAELKRLGAVIGGSPEAEKFVRYIQQPSTQRADSLGGADVHEVEEWLLPDALGHVEADIPQRRSSGATAVAAAPTRPPIPGVAGAPMGSRCRVHPAPPPPAEKPMAAAAKHEE